MLFIQFQQSVCVDLLYSYALPTCKSRARTRRMCANAKPAGSVQIDRLRKYIPAKERETVRPHLNPSQRTRSSRPADLCYFDESTQVLPGERSLKVSHLITFSRHSAICLMALMVSSMRCSSFANPRTTINTSAGADPNFACAFSFVLYQYKH